MFLLFGIGLGKKLQTLHIYICFCSRDRVLEKNSNPVYTVVSASRDLARKKRSVYTAVSAFRDWTRTKSPNPVYICSYSRVGAQKKTSNLVYTAVLAHGLGLGKKLDSRIYTVPAFRDRAREKINIPYICSCSMIQECFY